MFLLKKGNRYFYKIGDYFYQKRVFPGSRHYTRFIILGTGRTGSNMLLSALNAHPSAIVYGEIFNNSRHNRIGFNNKKKPYISLRKALEVRENNPISFVEDYIFRIFSVKTAAVGFKFFYWHCHEDNWRCIWDYLNSMQELKIIHIKRRNMLKTLLSLKIAQRTKQWSQTREKNQKKKPSLALDFNECVNIFEDWEAKEEYYDKYFAGHSIYEIFYEDLCDQYETKMKEVQHFLGLPSLYLKPSTIRQGSDNIAKVIANYVELKKKFNNTRWQHFFEM